MVKERTKEEELLEKLKEYDTQKISKKRQKGIIIENRMSYFHCWRY